jgi:hypothetical protein
MKTYEEALDWIDKRSKEYGGKNTFFSSCEYREKYPEIERLHKEAMGKHSEKAPGDKVFYDAVGSWGYVEAQEGTIYFDKKGIPRVKLASGKSVKWHKGFKSSKEHRRK